jgi:predicted Fe-Mo cluster-binding NifX family protein
MKVAVPTQDGTSISQHFGRSKSLFVFEVEDKKIVGRSVRDNPFTA